MDAAQIRAQAASLGMELFLLTSGEWAILRKGDVLSRSRALSDMERFLLSWKAYVK